MFTQLLAVGPIEVVKFDISNVFFLLNVLKKMRVIRQQESWGRLTFSNAQIHDSNLGGAIG